MLFYLCYFKLFLVCPIFFWNQIGVLYEKLIPMFVIPMFVTILSVSDDHEH